MSAMSAIPAMSAMSAAVLFLNVALVLLLAAAAGIALWRAVRARHVPVYLCMFLILPVGQLFMLRSFSFEGWSAYWLFGLLLGLASNVLLLVYAISQEKKTAAQDELQETRHRIELEKSHYEAVEQRREELDGMRRDFGEKLEAVARLVRAGEDDEARESISALAENLSRTKENPYCAIPVINAVLTKMENDCAAAGIALSIDLNLPNALAIEPMHLCSVFCNILDNAISACRELQGAGAAAGKRAGADADERVGVGMGADAGVGAGVGAYVIGAGADACAYAGSGAGAAAYASAGTGAGAARPVIRLSSIMDGDYLIIKTTNPAKKPGRRPAPGRGYGLRILSELTKQHGGDFQWHYRDGTFTALASLLAAGQ
ncbi:MAG: GHKL domain-containing protein [Clostridiales bacterium]|jgi:signal transduction histidine kinase|nr:GHKL domain-containing protein [Clostridiales bacterium]